MRRTKTHAHVKFEVISASGLERSFDDPDEALATAAMSAISTGSATLDVLIWSKSGARWYGGEDALKQYLEDPDASVFNRYEFKANDLGRVS